MAKVVYSRTLQHAEWNTTVVRDVVPEEVRALKERSGGDLGLGGEFLRLGFVDEYYEPGTNGDGA